MGTPSSPSLNLWTILSESKRIINAHSRHFLALSVVFLLPISFSSTVYPTLHTLISDQLPHNSQQFFLAIPNSTPTKPLLLALTFSLFVFLFSLLALASITYSVFHGFYGRPVKFISAVQSVGVSFFPVLGTVLASQIVFVLLALAAGLLLFLVVGVFEMIGLEMDYSSPYFVGLIISVAVCVLLCFLYFEVSWSLAGVVAVVEPRWGFNAMSRSGNLIKGMRWVALSLMVFFGVVTGFVGYCSSVSEMGLDGASSNWNSVVFVVKIVVFSMALMVVLLYHAAANVVLYMYCKAAHGELALEVAEEFAAEYVSLPFDDGKVPHLVSVAYVQ